MIEIYGPNSIKVNNFVAALKTTSAEQLDAISLRSDTTDKLLELVANLYAVGNQRIIERNQASQEVKKALTPEVSEAQLLICTFVGEWLVVEDLFSAADRAFVSLYLIKQYIDGKILYEGFRNEDWAIRAFCDRLSIIDGEPATIQASLDQRGSMGDGLPDFVIKRKQKHFTVEHTSLTSFTDQYRYKKLWDAVDTKKIEEAISTHFPGKWIKILIAVAELKSTKFVRSIDFSNLLSELISAIKNTPESFDASRSVPHILSSSQLPVYIAVDDGGYGCWIDPIAPVKREEIQRNLEAAFIKAFESKRAKMARAKDAGENTILLLDSTDISFTNISMLAEAFQAAAESSRLGLNEFDEIYLIYPFGSKVMAPVKLADRIYPDLPEFNRSLNKLLGIATYA